MPYGMVVETWMERMGALILLEESVMAATTAVKLKNQVGESFSYMTSVK